MIHAAGGVVWRPAADGIEVLVVHRPKYDDWSLPKGKLDDGEEHLEAAFREVEEETGFRCSIGPELASTSYRDRRGRSKTVRYWSMRVTDGEFVPNAEVDEVRWMAPDDAARLLTYERDRDLVIGALPALR